MGDDGELAELPAMKWLLSIVNESGSKKEEKLHDVLRSYSLAQANLYMSGLPKMSASDQAEKIGTAFMKHCALTKSKFDKVTPDSLTPELIRAKSFSLPKVPSNEDVVNQAKAVKAMIVNRLMPYYKSELVKRNPPTMPSGKRLEDILDKMLDKYWIEEERLRAKQRKKYQTKKKQKKAVCDDVVEDNSASPDSQPSLHQAIDFTTPDRSSRVVDEAQQPRPKGYMPGAMWVFVLMSEVAPDPAPLYLEAVDPAVGKALKDPIIVGPGELPLDGLGRDKKRKAMAFNIRIRANREIRERNVKRKKLRDEGVKGVSDDEETLEDGSTESTRKDVLKAPERQGEETTQAVKDGKRDDPREGRGETACDLSTYGGK